MKNCTIRYNFLLGNHSIHYSILFYSLPSVTQHKNRYLWTPNTFLTGWDLSTPNMCWSSLDHKCRWWSHNCIQLLKAVEFTQVSVTRSGIFPWSHCICDLPSSPLVFPSNWVASLFSDTNITSEKITFLYGKNYQTSLMQQNNTIKWNHFFSQLEEAVTEEITQNNTSRVILPRFSFP